MFPLVPRSTNVAALTAGGGGTDADALAWQAAVVGAGGTVSGTQLGYVSTLTAGLKADGSWAKLDRLWLYAAENATQASIDLVTRAAHTLHSSPTFTANTGYQGDGIAAWIDTGYRPEVTSPTNYIQNSASFGCWVVVGGASSGQTHMGSDSNRVLIFQNGTVVSFNINHGISTSFTFGSVTGLWHVNRSASNATQLYQNGSSVITDTKASNTIDAWNLFTLAVANNGSCTPQAFFAGQLAMVFAGADLSAGASAFNARIHTYLNSVNPGAFP
jgi:hypothetical protein